MSAKVMDYEGIRELLDRAKGLFPRLSHLWLGMQATAERIKVARLGGKGFRVDSGDRQATAQEACSQGGADGVG
jgi:hypothetical protein